MEVNFESLKEGLSLLTTALNAVKQVKDLLPRGSKTAEIETALQQAEHQLKLAESQTASSLGYELCREHWPPEIMRSQDNHQWTCPTCGQARNTGAASVTPDDPPGDWITFSHGRRRRL
jgi:hypothetical protein